MADKLAELLAYQLQELVARLVAFEENARESRCGGDGVGLLDAAHGHAGVHGFNDNGNAQWMEGVLDAVADLLGEAFLHLQTAGIRFHHAGNLAQAGDFPFGNIRHMGLADERQHVVLAQGEQLDVLHNDHVVVRLLEEGALDNGFSVLEIALGEELHGLGHTLRRFLQAFAGGVLSQQAQDGLNVGGNLLRSLGIVFFNLSVCHGLFFVAIVNKRTAKLAKKIHYIIFLSIFAVPIERLRR